ETHNFPFLILTPEETEEISVITTDLNSIQSTYAGKWISEGGVAAEWDAYLAELDRAGLSRYLEIYQAAYDRTR
ncbi:MAG TPA: sugar ABC transporter substrate-binding protein, partial [Clostridia bacterium]|nr:sugar ABC transporter substrate-binding protein [Clostridia bacterium]